MNYYKNSVRAQVVSRKVVHVPVFFGRRSKNRLCVRFPIKNLCITRGGRRDRTLYADSPPPPPPPPSLLGFGPEVPDHGRRRRPKEILLDLVEGEKMGFHPMCLYSKYSFFLGEPNSG